MEGVKGAWVKEEGNMDKNNWKEKGIEGRGKNEVHLNQGGILSEKSRNDDKMSKRWREKFVRNKEEKRERNIYNHFCTWQPQPSVPRKESVFQEYLFTCIKNIHKTKYCLLQVVSVLLCDLEILELQVLLGINLKKLQQNQDILLLSIIYTCN